MCKSDYFIPLLIYFKGFLDSRLNLKLSMASNPGLHAVAPAFSPTAHLDLAFSLSLSHVPFLCPCRFYAQQACAPLTYRQRDFSRPSLQCNFTVIALTTFLSPFTYLFPLMDFELFQVRIVLLFINLTSKAMPGQRQCPKFYEMEAQTSNRINKL